MVAPQRIALMSFLLIGLLCGGSGADDRPIKYPQREVEGARLEYIQGVPVMFLEGTAEQLGRQQAELTGDVIGPLTQMPKQTLAAHGGEKAWPFVSAMSKVLMHSAPQRYKSELDTFIEASGLDRDSLYVANSMIELRRMGGCSAFLVTPERSETGELLFGRNFDFPPLGVLHRYHCVLVVKPEGKRPYLSIGYPGLIGVISGMNDAGLTVATLDVYQSGDGSPFFDSTGVPLALTYRQILEECATVAEAEALLKETKRTTYMNLAVADSERAVVFEITPKQVGVRQTEGNVLSCTNHFRLDGLSVDKNCYRIARLSKLSESTPKFGIKQVQQAMHRVHQGQMTLQTMVFEPAALRVHVAMGGLGPVSNKPLRTLEAANWLRPKTESAEPKAAASAP